MTEKPVESPKLKEVVNRPWIANRGPQMDAYFSQADVLYYGGAAGGGKTSLLLGVAINQAKKARIYRKQAVDLAGLEQDFVELMGSREGFVKSPNMQFDDGRGHNIEFGHMQYGGDEKKYQGRARDTHLFDEATHFTEAQVSYVLGWLRSAEGHRCRAILASNPPMTAEGEWIISWFAPWLDEDWPDEDKAAPGELRWAIHEGNDIHWVKGKAAYKIEAGQPEYVCTFKEYLERSDYRRRGLFVPRSYTFIPARLDDNPYLKDSDYRQQIMAMDEPMRSRLLYGDYSVQTEDDPWQVIPTEWIKIAQNRWEPDGWRGLKMERIGVDVSQGGGDNTVFAPRYDFWYGEIMKHKGTDTPDGPSVVALLTPIMRDGAAVNIDVGGGYGNDAFRQLKQIGIPVAPCNGSSKSIINDRSGRLTFRNKRAEWLWGLREALDPIMGVGLALPPGREVVTDLASYRRIPTESNVIQIEPKEKQRERLGRSPDIGDAIMYAYADEPVSQERTVNRHHGIQTTAVSNTRISKRRVA